jgi:hypothetical protein
VWHLKNNEKLFTPGRTDAVETDDQVAAHGSNPARIKCLRFAASAPEADRRPLPIPAWPGFLQQRRTFSSCLPFRFGNGNDLNLQIRR